MRVHLMSKDIQGQESDEMIGQTKPLFDYLRVCFRVYVSRKQIKR